MPLVSSSFNPAHRTQGPSFNFLPFEFPGFEEECRQVSEVAKMLLRRRKSEALGLSEAKPEDGQFKIILNVAQFQPNEIEVKIVDNCVLIHGKHEEKADEHGLVSREFTRRHLLPEGVKPDTLKSALGQNGVLTIVAPKNGIQLGNRNERIVPIIMEKPAVVGELSNKMKSLRVK